MNTAEFSNEFDTLLNSYSANLEFGKASGLLDFDEYEKSVFLTKAQEEIVLNIYNGTSGPFENTELARRSLETLVCQGSVDEELDTSNHINNKSHVYRLSKDVWFIVHESVDWDKESVGCLNNIGIPVVPITHDEYNKLIKNPFRGISNNRVLRLEYNTNLEDTNISVELLSKYPIAKYLYRYIRKPNPIVLTTLPPDVSINGINQTTECELNSSLHRLILNRAVELAIASRSTTRA